MKITDAKTGEPLSGEFKTIEQGLFLLYEQVLDKTIRQLIDAGTLTDLADVERLREMGRAMAPQGIGQALMELREKIAETRIH